MSRIRYLEQGLSLSPITFARMLEQINPARYDQKIAPDRFSLREVLAHIADLEPVFQQRMELALTSPGSEVQNFDQDQQAIEKDYKSWKVETSLEMFTQERAKTVTLFNSLTENQQQMTVKHPILGLVSIYDLGVFLLGHDAYHVEQISSYLWL